MKFWIPELQPCIWSFSTLNSQHNLRTFRTTRISFDRNNKHIAHTLLLSNIQNYNDWVLFFRSRKDFILEPSNWQRLSLSGCFSYGGACCGRQLYVNIFTWKVRSLNLLWKKKILVVGTLVCEWCFAISISEVTLRWYTYMSVQFSFDCWMSEYVVDKRSTKWKWNVNIKELTSCISVNATLLS